MTMRTNPRRRPVRRPERPVVVNAYDIDAKTTRNFPFTSFNRVSLRAVIAGVLVALIVMLAMNVLGLAIGATTLDAMIDFNEDPAFDPEDGVIVWMAATNLLALFLGGWVAAYLAGVPDEIDGILHGVVTWAVTTLIVLWLFTTATGRVLNAAADAVGTGLDVIDAGVETVVPAAADAVQRVDYTADDIQEEARSLAAETGEPELQPEQIEQEGEEAEDIIEGAAEDIIEQPSNAGDRIQTAVENLLDLDAPSEADREAVVNVIVTNSDLSEEEAREAVDNWEQRYNEVDLNAEAAINDASETVTDAIATAAAVVFMGMVIGAIAAGVGGYVGAPTLADLEETYTYDETDETG